MYRTVIISGASRGIGSKCAETFAEGGYNVVINYLNSKEAALETARRIRESGGEAQIFRADVSDFRQCEELVRFSLDSYGHIDTLVNNAGVSFHGLVTETTDSQWDELFSVNVKGVFNLCKAALPSMISKKSGSIVNISSMWGITGAANEAAYSASKSAVIGFTKALAKETAPSGITVNCVAPGLIDTDMNRNLSEAERSAFIDDIPLLRIGSAADVADAVYRLSRAKYVTGQVLAVDGGITI